MSDISDTAESGDIDHDKTSNRNHSGDSISPNSVDVSSTFTDPSGTSHTGEIADKSDTGLTLVDSGSKSFGNMSIGGGNPMLYILDVGNQTLHVEDGAGNTDNFSVSGTQVGDIVSLVDDAGTFKYEIYRP